MQECDKKAMGKKTHSKTKASYTNDSQVRYNYT